MALTRSKEAMIEQLNRMQKEKCQKGPAIKLQETVEVILGGCRTIKIHLEGMSVQYAESLAKAKALREDLYVLTNIGPY